MKTKITTLISISVFSLLVGCNGNNIKTTDYETLKGSKITENETPYTQGLQCVSDRITIGRKIRLTIDQIPDKSGKVNSSEGYKLTQGVESMAITALTKIPAIQVVERRNIRAYNIEADLMRKKLIGDEKKYSLSDGKQINYRPMLSGSVSGADFYITGAITEVNYNIYSGGKMLHISGLELGKRTVVMNVAMDLRIVDVKTLDVINSISLQKQFVGERNKAGLYRFIKKELVNLDVGSSTDEPLQLGVRSLVERGVAQLVGDLFKVRVNECYDNSITIR
jgi:curli production assembly/transport component CsgG/holdfast attachment protein HfaB